MLQLSWPTLLLFPIVSYFSSHQTSCKSKLWQSGCYWKYELWFFLWYFSTFEKRRTL